ncbi:Protein YIPF5 [Thelohanellus kitauei]|uniref:Protein YIPF5 n=1 Tax=Thelohanellus kitauei TaxID=669202 RepID=A0A0C2N553_THEKT|nr:Protein YIPF5 [Thelohanellus kitauei]
MQFYEGPEQGFRGYNQYGQPQQNEFYGRNVFDPYGPPQNWDDKSRDPPDANHQYNPYDKTRLDEDEEPLMTELGINFYSIGKRTMSVINPFTKIDENIVLESDLAGPLVYFIVFGLFLLLVSFNLILVRKVEWIWCHLWRYCLQLLFHVVCIESDEHLAFFRLCSQYCGIRLVANDSRIIPDFYVPLHKLKRVIPDIIRI